MPDCGITLCGFGPSEPPPVFACIKIFFYALPRCSKNYKRNIIKVLLNTKGSRHVRIYKENFWYSPRPPD